MSKGIIKKHKAKKNKMLSRQRTVAVILACAVLLLAAALVAANRIVSNLPREFVDPADDKTYSIKKQNGEYALFSSDGQLCDMSDDGYYITSYGTLVKIDKESGKYTIDNGRELVYSRLYYDAYTSNGTTSYKDSQIINRLDISNMSGKYSFVRDNDRNFVIEGHENAAFTSETLAYVMSACSYPLSQRRLKDPHTLPNGEIDWSEYGLAAERRISDETGEEYDYFPTRATATTVSGEQYTLYIGDATVTENSYYVRYTEKDCVYVLSSTGIAEYMTKGVEAVISPMIVYPMTSTTYANVEDFIIYKDIDHAKIAELLEREFAGSENIDQEEYENLRKQLLEEYSTKMCHFSFQDLDERENSLYATLPFVSFLDYSDGYYINSTNITLMMQDLYETEFVSTIKLSPSDSQLEEYGLYDPDKIISFCYMYTDAEGKEARAYNLVRVSKQNPDGSYYAYSDEYDMIVCVDEASFSFLEWTELDWYDPNFMQININHVTDITVEAPASGKLQFTLDNSMTADGNIFPITQTKFDNGGDNSYEIKQDNNKLSLWENDRKLEPVFAQDYLVMGIPYTQGTAENDNYILSEVVPTDTDDDGTDDAYIYYYYNITYDNGALTLYVTMAAFDAYGNQLTKTQSSVLSATYTSDCLVTDGLSRYAFLLPQNSTAGKTLTDIYSSKNKGTWIKANIFVTAKGAYVMVDPSSGEWSRMSAVSNSVYIAQKEASKIWSSGVDVNIGGANETFYPNTGEILSLDTATNTLKLYNKTTASRRDATKGEVAPGVWSKGDFYVTASGDLIVMSDENGDVGLVELSSSAYIGAVYSNGKELTYTLPVTDSLGKTEQKSAMYNFQQFYSALLYSSIEGECTLTDEEMNNLRALDSFSEKDVASGEDNPCMLKLTVHAKDLKGNSKNLVYRFYRISERRAYMTVESLDSPTAESNSDNAYGRFVVLASYVEKLASDAQKVSNGTLVDSNSKY